MIVRVHRKIKSVVCETGETVKIDLPKTQSGEAAAVDLQSTEDFLLMPGDTRIVDTGLIVRAPRNYCFLVLSRSGLAAKYGVFVLNSPGLIDRDYSGPNDTVRVILHNVGKSPVPFHVGDRIAQLKLDPFTSIEWTEEEDPAFAGIVNRGGLGSTGVKTIRERLEEEAANDLTKFAIGKKNEQQNA